MSKEQDQVIGRAVQHLRDVGAPSIPEDAIIELNGTQFGKLLLFVSEHVKGRQGTLEVRQDIAS